MKTLALARDSLQLNPESLPKAIGKGNQMFAVLYDLILYVLMPIAFEMSYVKIFERSMAAYNINDLDAMSRLIVYFAIQWFLGVLVRRKYIGASLKRITLALLILIQLKEIFFEDVLFDMLLSMVMESGLMVLVFLKFAHLVVVLKMAGLSWVLLGALLASIANRSYFQHQFGKVLILIKKNMNTFMNRIHQCIIPYHWKSSYC